MPSATDSKSPSSATTRFLLKAQLRSPINYRLGLALLRCSLLFKQRGEGENEGASRACYTTSRTMFKHSCAMAD